MLDKSKGKTHINVSEKHDNCQINLINVRFFMIKINKSQSLYNSCVACQRNTNKKINQIHRDKAYFLFSLYNCQY